MLLVQYAVVFHRRSPKPIHLFAGCAMCFLSPALLGPCGVGIRVVSWMKIGADFLKHNQNLSLLLLFVWGDNMAVLTMEIGE